MFKWLKKLFIPHEHNNYKPHLFREFGVFVMFSIIVLAFLVAVLNQIIINKTSLTALVLPSVLVDYANENRSTENFKHLAVNSVLEKAAQLKANDMAEKGYFAHKSPDGHSPWYFFQQAGYDFSYAGENLAVNFTDSVEVSKAWMNSPGHRANIMNGNFSEIGIATAEGVYQGRKTVFVVQLFGRPAERASSPIVPVKTTTTTKPTTQAAKVTTTTPTTTTATAVLSESVSREIVGENGNSELFISVEKKSADYPTTTTEKYSSLFGRALMSPSKMLTSTYLFIALIIVVGLLLMLFIEIKRQHPRHILLAIGLLIIIIGLLYIYRFVLFTPLVIL
jgi:hypothetical protein